MKTPYPLNSRTHLSTDRGFGSNNPYLNKLELLKGLDFYCWNKTKFDYDLCCFNHAILLPKDKNGTQHPLYPYEKVIVDTLDNNKHLWVLKATGLGITELMLRYMAWLCLKDDKLTGSQMCIVTGPRIDLAITLIDRMKRLFFENEELGVKFNTRDTIIELNGVTITAYPSNHLDSMRGIKNVSFVLLDEADFFPIGQQQDARDVSERYIGKSNPFITMISTPDMPDGLFFSIESEPEDTCIYKRLKLDYTHGLNTIYSTEDIQKARQSPSWEKEYNLKYIGSIGNTFSITDIDHAIELGESLKDREISNYNMCSIGVDFGYGSSKTSILVTERIKENVNKIIVRFAEEYDHANPQAIVDIVHSLYRNHWNTWIWVDGSNRASVNLMKASFHESLNWEKSDDISPHSNKVLPINFQKYHKEMLQHTQLLLTKGYLAIPKQYDRVITSLRTAWSIDFDLDKDKTSFNDSLDALRLSLKAYVF